jgi:hypothetical protein
MSYSSNIAAIEELASSEGGVFTSGQAARAGIPRYALSHAAKSGRIERLRHGAYRLSSIPATALDDLVAVYKLTSPDRFTHERMGASFDGIAACGATAAHVLGVGDLEPEPWEIAVPKRFNSRMDGTRFRVVGLGRDDVVWTEVGLPVTRAERTIVDLAREATEESLLADVLADAIRRYGATELDMRRLRALLGDERTRSLLSAAGAYEGGPRELVELDGLGHVALIERS